VDRAKLQAVRLPEEKEMVESLSRSVNLPVLRRLGKENPPPLSPLCELFQGRRAQEAKSCRRK